MKLRTFTALLLAAIMLFALTACGSQAADDSSSDQQQEQQDTTANESNEFRVGMECAYEPYNWTDISGASFGAVPISGEGKDGLYANGYDVQIAKYVAARLGMNLEIYSIEWDSLLPALDTKPPLLREHRAGIRRDRRHCRRHEPHGRARCADRLHRYLLRIQPRRHHPQVI